MISDGKTIIACSSGGQVNAAIAIIRLSGSFSLTDFQPFFSHKISSQEPRMMTYTRLMDGSKAIDEICSCFFAGPASYTGENLLELYVHGSVLNVERVMKLFLRLSTVREAKPGEFSLRALQNKKLTLSQVEGLDLFLNASTPLALDQGMGLLHGELHQSYLALFDTYKRHKAALELLLDFHEDVGEAQAWTLLRETWGELSKQIESLARRVSPHSSRLLRPEIVLAGLPNAGKSTLFNALLSEERAIVSPIPGTTRDYLAEDISIDGVTYRLIDTAGIRETQNQIEGEGIKRTHDRLQKAFFSILLINPFESDVNELRSLLAQKFDLTFLTHGDRPGFKDACQAVQKKGVVLSGQVVALIGDISEQIRLVDAAVNKKYLELTNESPLLLDRHKSLILRLSAQTKNYQSVLVAQPDVGILSHELNDLAHCLQELLGVVSPDEVLDHIFANFCIGK